MNVGIVGLGLIGGSLVKAFHAAGRDRVLAFDREETVLSFALLSEVVDGVLDETTVSQCDLLLIALYPQTAIDCLQAMAPHIAKTAVVLDCCGVKRSVCAAGFALAEQYGFTFVGGHPMAGTHNSGFKYAKETLFRGAPMVLVPPTFDNIELLSRIKEMLAPVGFGKFSVTTAERHDETIAFTSQMAHLVSSAYIKSPAAARHKGFSAGSYKDMTRVAWLNPAMWTDLFLENRDNLLTELDCLTACLGAYRDALARGDGEVLEQLLEEGRRRKEEVDGR
ncbi:MAG: prephenate dehydrogenase/arogenate dehydrogenase family protein [Oscillospiraceae bacterium]|nr:prephenate dehydrogenase/arogenate dehydrogenase family protein [Oscillospiraceae bacterium]